MALKACAFGQPRAVAHGHDPCAVDQQIQGQQIQGQQIQGARAGAIAAPDRDTRLVADMSASAMWRSRCLGTIARPEMIGASITLTGRIAKAVHATEHEGTGLDRSAIVFESVASNEDP